jgi:hypothetical protein
MENYSLNRAGHISVRNVSILCVTKLKCRSSRMTKNMSFVQFGRNGTHDIRIEQIRYKAILTEGYTEPVLQN